MCIVPMERPRIAQCFIAGNNCSSESATPLSSVCKKGTSITASSCRMEFDHSMNGFLNIAKPRGLTSRQVVDLVNQILRRGGIRRRDLPKVGHAGTLDPLATGVLVVCLGAA